MAKKTKNSSQSRLVGTKKSRKKKISSSKYKLNPESIPEFSSPRTIIEGVVDMKQTGKAYIISNDSTEDIFVASNNTGQALNDDIVKVRLFPGRKDRKPEGEIIEIVERKRKHFVGVISIGRKVAFLIPDSPSIHVDFFIHLDDLNGAKDGMKVVAEITEWPKHSKNPFGKIIHIIGKPGDNDVEMQSILAQNDFPLSFGKEADKELKKITDIIPDSEIKKRRDFRNIFTITIDPEDAKDYDDAISIRKLNNGNYEIGVHIADVSYYVKPDTAIDKEAYIRGTSVYLVDRVISMLPEKLSNNLCSLQPQKDKLCFSAVFEIDKNATVLNQWFGKTIIKSDIRFNYEVVQDIIEGANHSHKKEIMTFHNIATILRNERFKKGAINFHSREIKFILDENSKPIRAELKVQKESNHLIEEFMLLANKKVTEWVNLTFGKDKKNKPVFVYRVHDEPKPEKLNIFAEYIAKLGYKLDTTSRKKFSYSLNKLLTDVQGKAEENLIETIAVRTMAKALYSPDNIGHYGLGFKYYTHFTSPIRRYPDLMIHRLLGVYLENQPANQAYNSLVGACKHCSDMEKKAVEAERDSVKYKQFEYMTDKVGQKFGGVISGVSKWGIFVELDEIKAEGLVRMKDIGNDFFYLDEENYCIIGYRNSKEYRLGDRVLTLVKSIDLSKKQMDLLIESHVVNG